MGCLNFMPLHFILKQHVKIGEGSVYIKLPLVVRYTTTLGLEKIVYV